MSNGPNAYAESVPYEASPEMQQALGELLLAFGWLELALDNTFKRLIQKKDPSKTITQCLKEAYELQTRLRLTKEIISKYALLAMNQETEYILNSHLSYIEKLFRDRNLIFHGCWHTRKDTGEHFIQFEYDGEPNSTPIPTLEEIQKIALEVWEKGKAFDDLTNPRNPKNLLSKLTTKPG